MFDDLKNSDSDYFIDIKISKKIIDELVACHGTVVMDSMGNFIISEIRDYVNDNLKNDENYYNKLRKDITQKILERKKK